MSLGSSETPLTLSAPVETHVVRPDGEVLLVIDGVLVLPLGARIQLSTDGLDAVVVGMRLARADPGPPRLLLEVDAGGSPLEEAAIKEAVAEAEVVEAAEEITSMAPEVPSEYPAV